MSVSPITPATYVAGIKPSENNSQHIVNLNLSMQIESSSVSLDFSDQNRAMDLVYKTAIDELNEKLEPYLGDDALQRGLEAGIDVSPEATAERIVQQSTAFYAAYREQHVGEDEESIVSGFVDVLTEGVEKGFDEARDILDALDVLEGEIATNIDKTYDLVIQGYEAFVENALELDLTKT